MTDHRTLREALEKVERDLRECADGNVCPQQPRSPEWYSEDRMEALRYGSRSAFITSMLMVRQLREALLAAPAPSFCNCPSPDDYGDIGITSHDCPVHGLAREAPADAPPATPEPLCRCGHARKLHRPNPGRPEPIVVRNFMSITEATLALATDTLSSDLLWEKLEDKDYRESFVAAQLSHGIPHQIRELMDEQGLTQPKLAELGHISQATVSRAIDPQYASLSTKSIVGIAAGLDVAFIGEFVSFSRLIEWFDKLPEWERKSVLTFADDDAKRKREKSEAQAKTAVTLVADTSFVPKDGAMHPREQPSEGRERQTADGTTPRHGCTECGQQFDDVLTLISHVSQHAQPAAEPPAPPAQVLTETELDDTAILVARGNVIGNLNKITFSHEALRAEVARLQEELNAKQEYLDGYREASNESVGQMQEYANELNRKLSAAEAEAQALRERLTAIAEPVVDSPIVRKWPPDETPKETP
jgi:transcriptional regulator with XRE-family HTH domain